MEQDYHQLIIKDMKLRCSMQLKLTYNNNQDQKLLIFQVVLSMAKVGRRTGTSTKDGRVAVLNSFITVKSVKYPVPVSVATLFISDPGSDSNIVINLCPQTYKDHLEGQKHKKKEAATRTLLPLVSLHSIV